MDRTTALEPMTDGPSAARATVDTAAQALAVKATAGAVYTMTNDSTGNAVAVYHRSAAGALTLVEMVQTGGRGTGAGLGSQGSLTRSSDGQWLLAVNAGSDELSLFSLKQSHPTLVATVASGGDMPVSVTESHGVVYVLNAGATNNIRGFSITKRSARKATLTPIDSANRALSMANAGGAQIQFTPRSDAVIVTEKTTNRILSYAVGLSGVAAAPTVTTSSGQTPFGFTFVGSDVLVVSEAFGGAANSSAASTYRVARDGALTLVSASVQTRQTSACWFTAPQGSRLAFAANTGSATVTAFQVATDGRLTIVGASGAAGTTGMTPTDEAMSADDRFLYTLDAGAHTISSFAVRADGSLALLGRTERMPASAVGLVAQ